MIRNDRLKIIENSASAQVALASIEPPYSVPNPQPAQANLVNLAREHEQDPQRLSDAQMSAPETSPISLEQYLYYDELAAKMKPVLEQQLSALDARYSKFMDQKMRQYLSTDLERQAFPTGILAELTYRANQQRAAS